MSDAPEMKPCPFCGGCNLSSGGDAAIVGVWCRDCQAVGPNHYGRHEWNTRAALREIEELEAKLEESEARSEVLETLVMDVAADLYDGVPAHKIDQRIGDVMRQLDEEEEED